MGNADPSNETTRQALQELQRYLGDEIAPLMAVDAARTLLRLPAKYGAVTVQQWLEAQLSAPDRAVTVSSYLYHAVKKINLFSEFNLVEPAAMQLYVARLSHLLVQMCPERERNELKLRLSRIGESETRLSAPVRWLNREAETAEEEERIRESLADPDDPAGRGRPKVLVSPRVSMLMNRLEALAGDAPKLGPEGDSSGASNEILASLVGRAAVDAADAGEFRASLDRVREMGIEPTFDRVFRELGKRLPGWDVELAGMKGSNDASIGHLLRAMHQIVALAETPEEGTDRFSSMVYTAIEQFNDGHLAQAVSMLDVARSLCDENKVDSGLAGIVRTRAEGSISMAAVRKFASNPGKHGLLRKVLGFFPAFSPESLLDRLDGEPRRDVRKLILSLLEVIGPPCRPQILDRLDRYVSGRLPDPESYCSRNAIFLLRRIPRGSDDRQDRELALVAECCRPEKASLVVKEAVGALARIESPDAERVLIDRLAAFTKGAIDGSLPYDPEDVLVILDRICDALARTNRTEAIQAVVSHGFRTEPGLGQTTWRLRHLAECDLARHPAPLRQLMEALRKMLPARVLGVVLGRRVHEVSHLIQALSGTPEPAVQSLLEEVVKRFAGRPFADEAAKALARLRARTEPEDEPESQHTLKGDLELFGLPNLLQTMADSSLTGRLVITGANGHDRATVEMREGKIRRCEVGRLRGLDAVCQLFERPQPGTFQFEKTRPSDLGAAEGAELDVVPTILEAMRRHDEFQQDRAVVPDGISLMPSGPEPSLPDGEQDAKIADAVWREARRGTAPESCEGIVADAYRVRRLYSHWLEVGALALRPAA